MLLDWSGCVGFRDLGGTPTMDGRVVRGGALLRSGELYDLAADTVRAIQAGAVSRIVDLRWDWECEQRPSPFAGDPVYRQVPVLSYPLGYEPPPDSYAPMLDHNAPGIAQAVGAVVDAPPGPVVVHCTAGRDRTGVVVALLLGVAGVAGDVIAADYAASARSTVPMMNTLLYLNDRYGGASPYLLGSGVTKRQLAATRERLVAP